MKFAKNKIIATMFTLFLMLTITDTLVLLQVANAHTPPYAYTTHCFVAPTPPIIGLGQQELIDWWLNWVPPTASGATGDRWKVYVDIMKPDGSNETFGPLTSDPVGGSFFWYTPSETGLYTVVCRFPGQTLTGLPGQTQSVYVNDTYASSVSMPQTFTVQEEKIPSYVDTPLPNDYWTRPIYDANRGWGNSMMGQWLNQPWDNTLRILGITNQQALLSPHVLWTRPEWTGGVMGGYGDASFYNGIAYEGFSSPLVCLNGMCYYPVQNPPIQGWYCINLYNGETEYFQNNTDGTLAMPTYGQVLNYQSPNQDGGFSYLWRTSGLTLGTGNGTVWQMLDGFTGNAICKIANVSTSGTGFRDSIGSLCYLNFANLGTTTAPNYYMQIWNTTQAIWWHSNYGIAPPATLYNGTTNVPLTDTSNDYWMWRPGSPTAGMSGTAYGAIYDGHNGYSMNISVASIFGPRNSVVNQTGAIQQIVPDQFVIVGAGGRNDARGIVDGYLRAYSLAAPTWGQTLWTTTFTPPAASDAYPNSTYNGGVAFGGVDWASGVFRYTESVTGRIWVYSIATGKQLWTYQYTVPWSYYGTALTFHNGFGYTTSVTTVPSSSAGGGAEIGSNYVMGTCGVLNCFNATTGELLWNWTAPNIGYLEVEGTTYTPLTLTFFVDDPVTQHTYLYMDGSIGWAGQTVPIRRDAALFCVDCNTGQMIWRLEAYPSVANNALSKVIISDGKILYLDNHDNNIYCLGKGPSATTVSAPQIDPPLGSSITITGTVTDQTNSGRINEAGSLDFVLKGTPAISDASMEAWMEYKFQQRTMPVNATGVLLSLDAIDPNGNYIHIGNVTSDLTGAYGFDWKPEVPGTYQIIATFKGSAAYGPSSAQTYMSVSEPAPTTSPYPVVSIPSTEMYFVASTVVIVSAIAIAAIAIMLVLKKKQ